jgi:CDP-diacylglycerol--glycerol-3-phosphate 3-phosphatidyltransferase
MLKINDSLLDPSQRITLRYIAVAIYILMAISDGLDGYLARRSKQITKLGAFLDPIADKLLVTSACLLLVSQRGHVERFLLPPTVVVLIIGKDLFLMIGFIIVYIITGLTRVAPVFMGKLATTLQFIMVLAILIAPEVSVVIPDWIWFLRFLWWSAAATAIFATLIYIRNGSRYIEEYERAVANKAKS